MLSIMAAPPQQFHNLTWTLGPTPTVAASLPPRKGPSLEKWQSHRSMITRLYRDENRTLKDVMAIMSEEFGHIATVKMYKSRITEWKLDKKKKESEMRAILRKKSQRDAIGKASSFRVRGKPVDIDEVYRYLKRKEPHLSSIFNPRTPEASTPADISCSTPVPSADDLEDVIDVEVGITLSDYLGGHLSVTPSSFRQNNLNHDARDQDAAWNFMLLPLPSPTIPQSILPPLILLIPERLFASIDTYLSGSISSKFWITDENGDLVTRQAARSDSIDYYNLCDSAIILMDRGAFFEGRRLLSRANAMIELILSEQSPAALENLLQTLRILMLNNEEIATMTRSYISQMATKILSKHHPYYQIYNLLAHVETVDLQPLLLQAFERIADTFERELGLFHQSALACRCNMLQHQTQYDSSSIERQLRRLLSDCERVCGLFDVRSIRILYSLGWHLYDEDRDLEAEEVAEDLLQRALTAASSLHEITGHRLLAYSRYALDKFDLAEQSLRRAIDLGEEDWGRTDPHVINDLLDLEIWLRRWGREEEADQVRADFMERIGPDDLDDVEMGQG